PTTGNDPTSDGTGAGSLTSSLTGLSPSTTYYVRGYATNSAGTAYSAETIFMTLASTAPVRAPDLHVTISAINTSVIAGEDITFEIVCDNRGDADANHVRLEIPLGDNLQFVSVGLIGDSQTPITDTQVG